MSISIVFGPPLAGKTTFVQLHEPTMHHISLGRIARKVSRGSSSISTTITASITNNTPLDSHLLLNLIFQNENLSSVKENVIDGYPKYVHEVDPLIDYCAKYKITTQNLYILERPYGLLKKRLKHRRVCENCYMPAALSGTCLCRNTHLYKREEDSVEYFQGRWERYIEQASGVISRLDKHFTSIVIKDE